MKGLRIALALALAGVGAAPVSAQFVLNLRDADVRAFIEDAARVTGRTFIVDSTVQGKVSVVTQRPLSRSEYFEVFLSTLRANGLVAVPSAGGSFRIQPAATAATAGGRVGPRAASANSFVTDIIRLRSVDAASAREAIRPLISREGSVTAGQTSLIVVDYADNVARARQVIAGIDRDTASTTVVTLDNAGAHEIADALGVLTGGDGAKGSVSIVPVDSSNSILLRGDGATVARLAQIARDLDQRASRGTDIRVIFLKHADAAQLLPVLQELLGQQPTQSSAQNSGLSERRSSFGQTGTSTGSGNGFGSSNTASQSLPTQAQAPTPAESGSSAPVGPGQAPIRNRNAVVTRFEGANALVIAAPTDVQRQLGEVIRQLDTRRDQVLVEALVAEISDNAAKELGVQLLLGSVNGSSTPLAVTNYSNIMPSILTIAGAVAAQALRTDTTTTNGQITTTGSTSAVADQLQQAAASQLLGTTGGLFGFGGKSGNTIFGAIIKAVKTDDKSNLLSTPSITTLDNQEAYILVGQEIPITTGQALSQNFDNTFRTTQRENVGVTLQVKPQINAGGTIKLDLRQEVSSIAGPVSNDNSDLILNKREIDTTITVDDGQIVAIGGLLDDNDRRTIQKVPLLGDIPVLGNLFKSRSRQHEKTNLMVFIRPTILRTAADAQEMTDRRWGYMRQQQYLQRPDVEPSLDELAREYMGTTPPAPVQIAPVPPLDPRTYAPPGTPANPAPPQVFAPPPASQPPQ